VPESVSFRHVFFGSAARGAGAPAAAEAALADLQDGAASGVNGLGDPPPMPPEVGDWTRPMVEARFGPGFAGSVFEAGPEGWSGPVASAYGYHLVFVTRRAPARVPDFAELAGRIATDLDAARRAGALDRIYASVRGSYQVEIEPAPADLSAHSSHPHDHAERTRA
jgi:peptidyl-prolyl cis-trans isomerase C